MDVRLAIAHQVSRGFLIGAIVAAIVIWLLQSKLTRERFNQVMAWTVVALVLAVLILHPPPIDPNGCVSSNPDAC